MFFGGQSVVKFHGDWLRELGDFALRSPKKKKKKLI